MRLHRQQKGSILLIFLLTLPFLILIATYYMQLSLTSFQVARMDQFKTQAQLAADAGADYAVGQISLDNDWTGTGGEITLYSDSKVRTTYTASVTNGTNTKTVAVVGKTYFPAASTTPARSVSINVDLRPVTTGEFSVISGEGGLIMSNASKIAGGDVFVNGEIILSNTSQIGLSTSPVTVSVADETCPKPPDSTYPRVCSAAESTQPIHINHSAKIYGTVRATNQTNSTGMSNPGLVSGTVAPQALPTYDRAAHKAAAVNNMTGSAASCSGNTTRIWPANTKITGNVTVSTQCQVTVMGDVWITGNLEASNTAQIKVDNSLGATRPNIMVDGSSGATFRNSSQLVSNATGTGFQILTFHSTASCSPDCSSVTGIDLANSRALSTITLLQSASAPKTIFYSYWTQVSVGNTGEIGALIGQTINLSNNSTITFGTSTSTGETIWVVKGYRRE